MDANCHWRIIFGFLLFIILSSPSFAAKRLSFDDLKGWGEDNYALALQVFVNSCAHVRDPKLVRSREWQQICAVAPRVKDPRDFLERYFVPVLPGDPEKSLFTGYYEPELEASLIRKGAYQTPLYARPSDHVEGQRYIPRSMIMRGALEGKGLELAYMKDPVEAFFLQVQGSGRLEFPDGSKRRIGFAAKNHYPYRSLGLELVRRGELKRSEASANAIKKWYWKNPKEGDLLLMHSPSFAFFRWIDNLVETQGPIGAMQVSVTANRTLAVDKKFFPLGLPVWMEKEGQDGFMRLMIAQDVGSAIKGEQRADIFYGSGAEAGNIASKIRGRGRMIALVPRGLVSSLYGI